MQETVVYLKKITQPEDEKKELERELSQCGWELFRMGMQERARKTVPAGASADLF